MNFRKQMKKEARSALKKHYVIFAAACLIAAFLSAEFTGALNFSRAQDYEQILLYEEEGKDVLIHLSTVPGLQRPCGLRRARFCARDGYKYLNP